MLSNNGKKLAAYLAVLMFLAAASLVAREVSLARQIVRNPELFVSGAEKSPPPSRAARESAPFTKPASESLEPMNASELAWVMRERLTLGVIGEFIGPGSDSSSYNDRIDEFNKAASVVRATESNIGAAKKRVMESRGKILSDAIDEAVAIAAPKKLEGDERAKTVWEAQSYLRRLAIFLGQPDGAEGGDTVYAVKLYQMRKNMPQTGVIDDALLLALRSDYLGKKMREDDNIGVE
jgi:hypothetical protein